MTGNKSQSGFTLVEVIISMAVFSVILITVSALYMSSTSVQRKGVGAQAVEENVQYILELMAREIRVGQITSSNVDCSVKIQNTLSILNSSGATVTYQLVGTAIQRTESGVTTTLSSSDVSFSRFNFCISGAGVDGKQARVAVVVQASNVTNIAKDKVTFNVETLVSNRELSSEF